MTGRGGLGVITGVVLVLLAVSCGDEDPRPPVDPTDPAGRYFDLDHVVEVALEMDPHDYEVMRHQTRTWWDFILAPDKTCMTRPVLSVFTDFHANATIDGQRLENVGLHKKGFLGSLDPDKPSLRVKFDQWVTGQNLAGLDRFVLNSSISDPSYVKQCLAYEMFAKAGVPAPRCNFAHVTMNGEDLGLYVHVEGMGKRFLRRHFENENGDLWKGVWADFRPSWLNMFELLTPNPPGDNQTQADRRRLVELADALGDLSDALMYSKVERLADVEQFLSFWAMEVLIDKWDGYANNASNMLVYDDPQTGHVVFIPWDTDGVFMSDPYRTPLPPPSVFANGILAHRLYRYPPTRDRYLTRLRELLDTVFHEDELIAEIDRMQEVIRPVLEAQPPGARAALDEIEKVRQYLRARRAILLEDLAQGPHPWTRPLIDSPCLDLAGQVTGTFSTLFGAKWEDSFGFGGGALQVTLPDREVSVPQAGVLTDQIYPAQLRVVIAGREADNRDGYDHWYAVFLWLRPEAFRDGAVLSLPSVEATGAMFMDNNLYVGSLYHGSLTLTRASPVAGAPVVGRLEATLIHWD